MTPSFIYNMNNIKKIILTVIWFIGWLLSPFTWWNDVFVNIPLAYLLGSVINFFVPKGFLVTFIFMYWLTNFIGIFIMHICHRELLRDRFRVESRHSLVLTILIYSFIITALVLFKVVKPIQ